MSVAYLNGVFVPLEEARISVLDRGFLFGDGVYELIPVYRGHLFRLQQHLARFDGSLAAIRVRNPRVQSEWAQVLGELVERNGGGNQAIYLQATRGVATRRHAFPAAIPLTIFAMSMPREDPGKNVSKKAITGTDNRWLRCDIKAVSLLPNVLLRQEAEEQGAVECILIRDGLVTEGAASNVFVVKAGHIRTPPKGPLLLPGITRDLVLELAFECGLSCTESAVTEGDLREADEIWVTSSTMEVQPIIELDGAAVGTGRPGALWKQIHAAFQDYTQQLCGADS